MEKSVFLTKIYEFNNIPIMEMNLNVLAIVIPFDVKWFLYLKLKRISRETVNISLYPPPTTAIQSHLFLHSRLNIILTLNTKSFGDVVWC